jgi:spermidine/putrescine transport system substrate-binding protein
MKPVETADTAPVEAESEEPLLFTWENWNNPPFLAEYKEKYGVEPQTAIFADEDEAFAKMRTGYKPDVMGPCSYEFGRWQEAGLIQPIDVTKLKNWKDIPDYLKNVPGMMKSETEAWFIPQYFANTSVTYRTDLAPEYVGKESWKILFDPKYKGKVSAMEGVDDTVTLVAKTWDVDPYNMTPEQWKLVQDKLRELVANARMITSDETSLSQALASGEIVAAITWNQTHRSLKREGKPVAFMNPPGGMFTYLCGMVLHAETKKLEKAYALIDSGISKAAMKYQLDELGNGPANTSILADYTDEQLKEMGMSRDVKKFIESGTFQVRLKNKDEILKFWTDVRGGG